MDTSEVLPTIFCVCGEWFPRGTIVTFGGSGVEPRTLEVVASSPGDRFPRPHSHLTPGALDILAKCGVPPVIPVE